MGGVIDGQDVNQTITNAAFIEKNANDTMPFLLAFTAVSEGANIASIQAAANKLYACTGASESTTGTVYGAPASTITDGQSHQTALTELANKFDPSTGHRHTGAAGDAPAISAGGITNVPLLGYIEKAGTNVTATGASTDVSAILSGKSPSTSSSTLGIPTTPPNNKVKLFYASGAPTLQDPIDSTGNIVYGRITFSASVWTLSYFSEIAGAETSYAGFSSTSLIWYFQELFNPLNSASAPPVYAQENNLLGSSYVAAIPTSTTSIAGKTTLSSATPPAVAAAGSAGTANGTVANANHTHAGVASIAASGSTPLLAAVTVTGINGISVTQSGQNIQFDGSGSGSNQNPNTIYAGPATGSAAPPTFRTMVPLDRPMIIVSKTTTYTATTAEDIILCSGSAFTVTLPTAASCPGKQFVIKKTDSSFTNIITIARASSDTIDGATSVTLNTQYDEYTIVSDGTATWNVLSHWYPSVWTTYTMTIGATTTPPTKGSASVDVAAWKRFGDSAYIKYNLIYSTAGTAGSGTYLFPLPSGLSANTSIQNVSTTVNQALVGSGGHIGIGGGQIINQTQLYNSTNLAIVYQNGSTVLMAFIGSGAYDFANANQSFSFTALVPISGWTG